MGRFGFEAGIVGGFAAGDVRIEREARSWYIGSHTISSYGNLNPKRCALIFSLPVISLHGLDHRLLSNPRPSTSCQPAIFRIRMLGDFSSRRHKRAASVPKERRGVQITPEKQFALVAHLAVSCIESFLGARFVIGSHRR
jgi:hypothetical protein